MTRFVTILTLCGIISCAQAASDPVFDVKEEAVRLRDRILESTSFDIEHVTKCMRDRCLALSHSMGIFNEETLLVGEHMAMSDSLHSPGFIRRLFDCWLVLLVVPELLGAVFTLAGAVPLRTYMLYGAIYLAAMLALLVYFYKSATGRVADLIASAFAFNCMPLLELWLLLDSTEQTSAARLIAEMCNGLAKKNNEWRLDGTLAIVPVRRKNKRGDTLKALHRIVDTLVPNPLLKIGNVEGLVTSTGSTKLVVPHVRGLVKALATGKADTIHGAIKTLQTALVGTSLGGEGSYFRQLLDQLALSR